MAENTKDAFYFPHFCNARHDRKIRRVRKELGVEGYGIFFMLLEILRDQTDYRYPIEDIDLIAEEISTSEQKVRTVICNYGLFEIDEDEMFFSSNLIVYLQPYLNNKERKKISGIRGNLIRYKYITKEESDGMTDEDILLRSKEIESFSHSDGLGIAIKVNKNKTNKTNKNKYNPADDFVFFNDSDFQEVWRDFKSVRTKKKASNSDRAIKAIITKLVEYSKNDKSTAIEIIGKSADSGWSSIYPLKDSVQPEEKPFDREEAKRKFFEKNNIRIEEF